MQGGKFSIGSATYPYTKKAKITLYGEVEASTVVMGGAVEAGNKIIANNGSFKLFGKTRSRMARLTAEA